jgi:hypothetical protein
LQKKIGEVSGQLSELRNLTQSMKDENEKLAGSWKSLADVCRNTVMLFII